MRSKFKSPLRYPGGKSRVAEKIAAGLAKATKHPSRPIASPFFGGGSVELRLAEKGFQVRGTDIFYPVARFWQVLKHQPQELHAAVSEFLPGVDQQAFKLLQEELRHLNETKGDPMRTATLFFVINRSSFSGTALSGGMSPGCPRFTQSSVNRLLQVDLSNVEVIHGDYWSDLLDPELGHEWSAVFADPPYPLERGKDKLYGDRGSAHDGFDHALFAERMNALMQQSGGMPTDTSEGFLSEPTQLAFAFGQEVQSAHELRAKTG